MSPNHAVAHRPPNGELLMRGRNGSGTGATKRTPSAAASGAWGHQHLPAVLLGQPVKEGVGARNSATAVRAAPLASTLSPRVGRASVVFSSRGPGRCHFLPVEPRSTSRQTTVKPFAAMKSLRGEKAVTVGTWKTEPYSSFPPVPEVGSRSIPKMLENSQVLCSVSQKGMRGQALTESTGAVDKGSALQVPRASKGAREQKPVFLHHPRPKRAPFSSQGSHLPFLHVTAGVETRDAGWVTGDQDQARLW